MCGRFAIIVDPTRLRQKYGVTTNLSFENHNVAPTQEAPVIVQTGNERQLQLFRFGLIPFWAKDVKSGSRQINARIETVLDKPAYRSAVRKRRCVIPVSGFYEWQDQTRQPFYFTDPDNQGLSLGGIWEHNTKNGQDIHSFAILTTEPHPNVQDVHGRTPLLLPDRSVGDWLDAEEIQENHLQGFAADCHRVALQRWPVSRDVNSPRHNGANLLQPVEQEPIPASPASTAELMVPA